MTLCFLFNIDVGTLEVITTDLLSHTNSIGPSIGIPEHLSFYRSASTISVHIRSEMNSDPKLEASTVFCLLLYQNIGVRIYRSI